MASVSCQVEVDFAKFENTDRQKQVPRPTSHEPVQIQLTVPRNVRFTPVKIRGVIWKQRQTIAISDAGNGRQEVEPEGPFAECMNQQSCKNGRFTCSKVEKLSKVRMRLKLRLHAKLTQAVARGVDLLSNELNLKGGHQTSHRTLLGRTVSGVNAARFTTQQRNSDIHVSHGVEGGTDIGGCGQTRSSPTEWNVESTSGSSEQVPGARTHSNTFGLSSKIHPRCIYPTLVRLPFYLSIKH